MLRILLAYLTFPGIVVHEFAHAWACRRLGIQVVRVCYLRLGQPMGYVLHEAPPSTAAHILVAVAPFFVSTLLAALLSLASCLAGGYSPTAITSPGVWLGIWCSFSLALHAFPSQGDAEALRRHAGRTRFNPLPWLLIMPAVAAIRLGQLGRRLWLDVLLALLVVALPPAGLLVLWS